jgi:hypothetical protein
LIRRGPSEIEAQTGSWSYSLGYQHTDIWDLDGALNTLLDRLPDEGAVWEGITRGYQADIFCGLFMGTGNQGTDLQPATLARLAARRLALSLDIYGP